MIGLPLFIGLAISTAEALPQQLTQQGRLLDASGLAVTGGHDLHFKIYNDGFSGSLLWEDTLTVNFDNGYYAAILGGDVVNNPLDESILSQAPIYLEIAIDNNGPMSPRQPINAAPYAQMARIAESVDGGVVNAADLRIGGTLVVDTNGSWVGPTMAVNWNTISGIPTDIADGDSDTLAGLTCNSGQIAGWNGSNWICTDDNGLTEAEVESYIENGPINLASGSTLGGLSILTTADQGDSLADLSCLNGEIPKWDVVSGWICSTDNDANDWIGLQNIPTDLSDGDNDTLQSLSCQDGETAKWNQAQGWMCSPDNDSTDWNGLQNIPADLSDGDNDALASLVCQDNEGPVYDSAIGWTCGTGSTIHAIQCAEGEVLSSVAGTWSCTSFQAMLDADNDGVMAWNDCNDADSAQGANLNDQDCDGFTNSIDCDDFDPNSLTTTQDGDCDGTLTADDCDDSDASSTIIADDADCDGALTADDCDDSDASSTIVADDADCDGYVSAIDCDDTNPNVNPGATELDNDGIDNDCDGVTDIPYFIDNGYYVSVDTYQGNFNANGGFCTDLVGQQAYISHSGTSGSYSVWAGNDQTPHPQHNCNAYSTNSGSNQGYGYPGGYGSCDEWRHVVCTTNPNQCNGGSSWCGTWD